MNKDSRYYNLRLDIKNESISLYKHVINKFVSMRNNKIKSKEYFNKRKAKKLPFRVIRKFFKSLLNGKTYRMRRFLSNPLIKSGFGRKRSIAFILFTAVCCS